MYHPNGLSTCLQTNTTLRFNSLGDITTIKRSFSVLFFLFWALLVITSACTFVYTRFCTHDKLFNVTYFKFLSLLL